MLIRRHLESDDGPDATSITTRWIIVTTRRPAADSRPSWMAHGGVHEGMSPTPRWSAGNVVIFSNPATTGEPGDRCVSNRSAHLKSFTLSRVSCVSPAYRHS
jgi:hypothetical protein